MVVRRHRILPSLAFAFLSVMGPQRIALAQSSSPTPPAAQAGAPKLTKPPKLVRFVEAVYPESERAQGRAAAVVMRLAIGATGSVDDAAVVESAGAAFDAAAVAAARAFVFEPAEIDGKAAAIRILYRYEFTLTPEVPKTAVFEGTVRDRTSGKPLASVHVRLDSGATTDTDAEGHFRFDEVAPGTHAVALDGDALTAVRTEETFEAGKKVDVDYRVQGVTAGSTDAGDKDDLEIVVTAPALAKQVVASAVSADEGRRLPGTQGDVLKVVESMPGVARSSVGAGQLIVWGAAPEDTRVYVDGVRLPRLYHGGGLRSVVATELVDSVELAPGGYGASYGRGLGGLVTVRTRRADDKQFHASAAVDLLDAAATVRTPIANGVNVQLAARRSHLHTAIEPFTNGDAEDFFPIPRYHDAQGRIAFALGAHERVDVTGLLSSDRISRTALDADPLLTRRETRETSFERVYVRWEKDLPTGSVSVVPWFGFDRNRTENRFGDVPATLATSSTVYGFRASYQDKVSKFLVVNVGLDAEVNDARVNRSGSITNPPREGDVHVFGQVPQDRVNADEWKVVTAGLAPFGELDFSLFESKLHVLPGVRFDPYFVSVSRRTPREGDTPALGSFRQDAALEPRLAVRWAATDRLDVKAGWGRYHQLPAPEDLSAVFGNPQLPVSAAEHFLAGTAVRLFPATSLETTAFYVTQSDLAVRNPASSPLLAEALLPIGAGRSYGAQMLLRKSPTAGFSGWISYGIVRSLRQDTPDGDYRLSDYDQTHVLTGLASYDLGKGFEVGARARFSSGFPRTPVVRATYDSRRDVWQPVFGAQNSDRIPAFFQVDLRVAKRFKMPVGDLEAYLEVQNVTNRENPEEIVYSSDYRSKGYITGLPILPVFGAKWSL